MTPEDIADADEYDEAERHAALLMACDRLHDACRSWGDGACIGPQGHFIEALNVYGALRDLPLARRMLLMGMVSVVGLHVDNLWTEQVPDVPDLG